MNQPHARRLAAILAADVVRYSALMAEDEAGTLEALRRLRRELFHPAVAGHRGKIIKAMGDGWLVEFASAVDAVNCAIRMQTGLETDPKIRIRIGIHIGDIVHEEEDIYGDAVNVAARLEAQADPGAVVISDSVYNSLDGTLTPSFDDAGQLALKNIRRPVRVWVRGALSRPLERSPFVGGEPDHPASWPILAVQPVSISDRRPEVGELAAALTSDLRNYLDKSRWLSTRIMETPPKEAYVLSGTLRTSGDRLRLETELSKDDAGTLWSHRSDGDLSDSFGWQDKTGADVASGAMGVMAHIERRRVSAIARNAMDAETSLLAVALDVSRSIDGVRAELGHIERSIAARPDWGLPYAHGALRLWSSLCMGYADRLHDYRDRLSDWIEQATRLLPPDSPYQFVIAPARHWLSPEPDRLRAMRDSVLRRSPFHYDALAAGYFSALLLGEPEDVIVYADRALIFTADTLAAAGQYNVKGIASVMLGRDEDALAFTAKAIALSPSFVAPKYVRAAAMAHLHRLEEAADLIEEYRRIRPGASIGEVQERLRYAETPEVLRYFDGLRLAGLPEGEP